MKISIKLSDRAISFALYCTWNDLQHLFFFLSKDDPLSALDVHVGAHVFQRAIIEMLLKKRITVILVTHQLQFLQQADQVL